MAVPAMGVALHEMNVDEVSACVAGAKMFVAVSATFVAMPEMFLDFSSSCGCNAASGAATSVEMAF